MATPAQIQANRRNAQHSTGPKTSAGKANVRQNASQHGLCAQDNLLPGEDPAEFAEFARCRRLELDAGNYSVGGNLLVNRVIRLEWKLRRIPRLEALAMRKLIADLPAGADPHEAIVAGLLVDEKGQPTLAKLQTYELRLGREIRACLKQLDVHHSRRTPRDVGQAYCDGYNEGVREEAAARQRVEPLVPLKQTSFERVEPCPDPVLMQDDEAAEAERAAEEVERAQAEHDAERANRESVEQSQFASNDWPQQELDVIEGDQVRLGSGKEPSPRPLPEYRERNMQVERGVA